MTNSQESSQAWQKIARASLQRRLLPGITVILLMVIFRTLGAFQQWEWNMLDRFLHWRPAEPTDERLLIVSVNEADIQEVGQYPIPDQYFADLITQLQASQPRAIGLDVFRDFPIEPGHDALSELFANSPDVFGIEKVVSEPVSPAASLPPERIGFIDFPLDADGFVRRAYLGAFPSPGQPDVDRFRLAFPLLLAQAYLEKNGLILQEGIRNPDNMRFGDAELIRFRPNSGSYIRANASGVQIFINVRSGESPFEVVSMMDVLEGRVDDSQIRDRVVLIGITSLSHKDLVNSAAVNAENPGLFYGIEMHAHIVSQILSTVINGRPGIISLSDPLEYLWIVLWGSIGMVLIWFISRPAWYLLVVGLIALGLTGGSLALLWFVGWWIPVMPSLIVFTLNGLVLPAFYLYDQTLRSRITERQQVIEETYDAIHNGPLQSLALLLRQRDSLAPETVARLSDLNQDLRTVYNRLQQESLPQEDQLQLGSQQVIDLRNAFHEVLYEVYTETIQRDFPGFDTLKFKVVKFDPLHEARISTSDRRAICRLLEEMICNVGKHAVNPKRLTVTCSTTETENVILVADNGKGNADTLSPNPSTTPTSGGRGTQQAQDLAHRLGGTFQRTFEKTGTRCELRWPQKKQPWWQRGEHISTPDSAQF